jgi:hypothetical protein
MIMRLLKTAALAWVANKVAEKVFGRKPAAQTTASARRTVKA